jgi:hypothetical protein
MDYEAFFRERLDALVTALCDVSENPALRWAA